MARALSAAYGVPVDPERVVFTVGGHHAIAATMAAFRAAWLRRTPTRAPYVVSALPFYPAHCGWASHKNRMLFADCTGDACLTADALRRALATLGDGDEVGMFCFCTPNNPLGYVISEAEWQRIIPVLREHPEAVRQWEKGLVLALEVVLSSF